MDSRCLTQPARLPGHMELQLFVCICCFCIHTNLHRHPVLIVKTYSASGSFSLQHIFIFFFWNEDTRLWMCHGEENEIPALNCASLNWASHCSRAADLQSGCASALLHHRTRCAAAQCTVAAACWRPSKRAQQQAAPVHTSTQTLPSRGHQWWEAERLFEAIPDFTLSVCVSSLCT